MMREIGGVEMPEFLGRLVPTKGADADTESDSESEAEPAANGMEEGADEAAA